MNEPKKLNTVADLLNHFSDRIARGETSTFSYTTTCGCCTHFKLVPTFWDTEFCHEGHDGRLNPNGPTSKLEVN